MKSVVRLLPGVLLACGLFAAAGSVHAQAGFPSRPVRIIVPFEPGGTTDTLARLIAPRMSADLGQPVVIENRGGANSIIGTAAAAAAQADGHTLLVGTSAMSLNQGFANKGLAPKLAYDTARDFQGVALMAITPYLLLTNSSQPYGTLRELVAQAKAQPGRIAFGSAGTGGSPHLGGILLGERTGVEFLHVPYKGSGPAMMALLQSQVQFTFASLASAKPHVDAGRLRIVAVAAPKRVGFLPDVPTIGEAGAPGAEVDSWFGLLVPAGTPVAHRERLARAIRVALDDPKIAERLLQIGAERPDMDVAAFDAFFRKDVQQWDGFIRDFKGSLQ